jgi:hypothetical protein
MELTMRFLNENGDENIPWYIFDRCMILSENAIKLEWNFVTWYGYSYVILQRCVNCGNYVRSNEMRRLI